MNDVNDFKIGVIYKYTSPSNKVYIGQTTNERVRKGKHRYDSKKINNYFYKAVRKHGWENFKYEVIIKFRQTADIEKLKRVLNKLETRYIKLYKSNDKNFGYNSNMGGDNPIGYKHTEEMIEYIRQTSIDRMKSPEMRELARQGALNKTHTVSPETKEILSSKCKTKKKVLKLNTKLEVVNTFDSIADAARSIKTEATIKTKSNKISEVCKGKLKSAYDFIWEFEN